MKKANLLTYFVMSLGLAPYAAAQPEAGGPSVEQAAEEYRNREEALANFQSTLHEKSPGGQKADDEQPRDQLRLLVKEAFYARQKLRFEQVQELERRLKEIRLAIAKTQQNEEVIINSRLDELLSGQAAGRRTRYIEEQAVVDGKTVTIRKPVYETVGAPSGVPQDLGETVDLHLTPGGPVLSSQPGGATVPRQVGKGRPTGEEVVVGEREEQVVVDGKTVTRRVPVTIRKPIFGGGAQANKFDPDGDISESRPIIPTSGGPMVVPGSAAASERPQSPLADFDIETRERLAELDVQAAEEDYLAAENNLSQIRKSNETGAVPASAVSKFEKDHRHAAIELKRAKAKLAGLARQRAELEAAAEAAVEEAEAERDRAAALVPREVAAKDAADAQLDEAQAQVEAAQAALAYQQKTFERIKNLVAEKAVHEKLLHEREEALAAAQSNLDSAEASVRGNEATVHQRKSAITVAQHSLKLAEARLRAATAARDRLKRSSEKPNPFEGNVEGPSPKTQTPNDPPERSR